MNVASRRPAFGACCAALLAFACLSAQTATAATVEKSEALPGGAEDQQAVEPNKAPIPADGAPSAAARDARLAEKGMTAGSPVMLRIFKSESELEVWMQKGDRFELFATHRICFWSGKLGPKVREGDRQAPEGFYSVGARQIHRKGRWPRSLNIGYPNALDRAHGRTGSYILVHGGCTSTGCYAMTNPVMEEVYGLVDTALKRGQERVDVHVFPFRMTDGNLSAHATSEWREFWLDFKHAYELFERTRLPPRITVCNKRYVATEAVPDGGEAASVVAGADGAGPGAACAEDRMETAAATGEERGVRAKKGRKVASKTQSRRVVRRNTRKAYAAARRARMAAHSKHARARQASAAKRAH